MAILQQPDSINPTPPALQTAAVFAAYVTLSLAGGAVLGWALVDAFSDSALVERFGAPRVLRRVQTLVAVLLAPWLLRKVGWRGWRDLGWAVPAGAPPAKKDFAAGFGLGFAIMGGLMVLSLLLGIRVWDHSRDWSVSGKILSAFLVTGLAVGVIEETLTRGVLYRSLARCWGAAGAMLVTGGVFAYAHFLKARPEAFEEGALATLRSSLFDGLSAERVELQLLNLTLLAVVLSLMVHKRGHIWMAVGFHAAVVGMIKTNSVLADQAPDRVSGFWFGSKVEFTDGGMCSLLLLLLIAWTALGWDRQRE